MTGIFLSELILAFTVGSIWVTVSTIIAERLDTRWGGFIGGLPSTVVVALFFIGWTQSPMVAVQSTTVIPIISGVDAFFVITFILLSRNFYYALCGSLSVWAILSLGIVYFKLSFLVSLTGCLTFLGVSYCILKAKLNTKSIFQEKIRYTVPQLLFRALLSGSIIVFAVLMAKIGGPLLGGMFAAFPAIFLSAIIIIYKAHGREFSNALMKVLMVSGCLNVVVYSIGVRYLILPLGIKYGTVMSFVISIIFACFLYVFVIKKIS